MRDVVAVTVPSSAVIFPTGAVCAFATGMQMKLINAKMIKRECFMNIPFSDGVPVPKDTRDSGISQCDLAFVLRAYWYSKWCLEFKLLPQP